MEGGGGGQNEPPIAFFRPKNFKLLCNENENFQYL